MNLGGIEAGGTKWVCGIGDGSGALLSSETFPTAGPSETIGRAVRFFADRGLSALGVGSFGPVDNRPGSVSFGRIMSTPKPGWAGVNLVAAFREALGLAVALDTDVNAALLAEARWGAGRGIDDLAYVTVGTGIGGGALVGGELLRGELHPELGHMRVPHDRVRDPFAGVCPFHGDCLEGLASGRAIAARWQRPAEELDDDGAWELEAEYLGLGLVNLVCVLTPQRLIVGGGVAKRPDLLPRVRRHLERLLGGYFDGFPLGAAALGDEYVVEPELGDRAGVLGAIELARRCAQAGAGRR